MSSTYESAETTLDRLFRQGGLDPYPIDEQSKLALMNILSSYCIDNEGQVTIERDDAEASCLPILKRVAHKDMSSFVKDSSLEKSTLSQSVQGTNSLDSYLAPDGCTVSTKQLKDGLDLADLVILKQMEVQTRMMIQIHERIDELSKTMNNRMQTQHVPKQLPTSNEHPTVGQYPVQQHRVHETPRITFYHMLTHMIETIRLSPSRAYNSKLGMVIRLFFALYRRHVRPFEIGRAIKILFMVSIFMARMRIRLFVNDQSLLGNISFTTKFTIVSILVFTGFLFQNGFFKFLYFFFIKENYPGKIFSRDDSDFDHFLEEQPQARNTDQNNGAANAEMANNERNENQRNPDFMGNHREAITNFVTRFFDWRDTLLGGGIAQVQRNNDVPLWRRGLLIRILQDFFFIFGSFFLSIFPMWRPVAVQPRPPPVEEEVIARREEDGIPRVDHPADPGLHDD